MESRVEYRVLAPDSVAWYIQAALVADRKGNESTRDLALAEAQRIAAERRLVEGPAPDGSRVLAYDVADVLRLADRLATIERRQEEDAVTFGEHARRLSDLETAMRIEHRIMHGTFNEHQASLDDHERMKERITILEEQLGRRIDAVDEELGDQTQRLGALEAVRTPVASGGWMGQVERRLIELENWRQEL